MFLQLEYVFHNEGNTCSDQWSLPKVEATCGKTLGILPKPKLR